MAIKVIVTGVTGMVGEGVLHECLHHPQIESVLVVGRRPCGVSHPKIKEIVHADFYNLSPIADQLKGYNACFFCLGVSSVGMKEEEYYQKTHTLTLHFANVLKLQNPDLTFCYVSGTGTDSTEKGKSMWARVKGKTENALLKIFPKAYMFRPGYMHPTPGLKNVNKLYKFLGWTYPLFRALGKASTLKEQALAMINAALKGSDKKVLEVKDIIELAKK